METSNLFFVGYGSIEKLIEQGKPNLKAAIYVQAMRRNNVGANPHGVGSTRAWISVAYIEAGVCHYADVVYGRYQTIYGEPLGAEDAAEQTRRRGLQALHLTKAWLAHSGYRNVREATIATPKDLVMIDGDFGFIVWDDQVNSYRRVTDVEKRMADGAESAEASGVAAGEVRS
jgi:hypothetical protein